MATQYTQEELHVKRSKYTEQAFFDKLDRHGVVESSRDISYVTTDDDWELAVSEYHDPVHRPVTKKYPVLLCHGLGNSHLMFDLMPEYSLANWLVEQGYAVYSVDLRGHGLSEKPNVKVPFNGKKKTWDWGFPDYLQRDLKATVDHVLKRSGADSLHFIGHSMGGILLFCYAGLDLKGIRSGITLGSSLNYSLGPSRFKLLEPFTFTTYAVKKTPIDLVTYVYSLVNKCHKKLISRMFASPSNVEPRIYRLFLETTFHPFSSKVLRNLADIIKGRGMLSLEGDNINQRLQDNGYPFPILSMGGSDDKQNCEKSISAFGTEYKMYGKPYGHKADYGHHDFITGLHAKEELYPDILAWLDRHDEV